MIHFQGVSRSFGSFVALNDVTLTVPAARVGLLGPNGAGKSTFLKIVLGLLAPSAGSGSVLGQPLATGHGGEAGRLLRRRIGFMPEAEALVPGLTGVEYVALAGELCGMPRRDAERRAHEMLSFLRLEEARYRPVEQYSAGMKQRVKLAQAIVHDPELILLDEPTSGLDPAGRDAMLRLIRELAVEHGKRIVLSTHLLADVQAVCDRVVIMAGGRVCLEGPVDELCAKRDDRVRLKVQGHAEAVRKDLLARGVDDLGDTSAGEWRLRLPGGMTSRDLFATALRHGAAIRSLTRDDETLEELFLRSVGHEPNPTGSRHART
jgi:ABC-2 type transport system ATP-binding protein